MTWNWQQPDWPSFRWDQSALDEAERRFLHNAGTAAGTLRHMGDADRTELTIGLLGAEALKTSEIEGDILDRDSVRSSILLNFGLATDNRRVPPAERGIADMMVDLHRTFDEPLSHGKLFAWHGMLAGGRNDLADIGRYRTHEDTMRVVSGHLHDPKIHFEAPPSTGISGRMDLFIDWFNGEELPPVTKAGVAHLYFESIHPFEDGNGRIGRAISEMALSKGLGRPVLLALSETIMAGQKRYYEMLGRSNRDLEVTGWLAYFAETVLAAQDRSMRLVDFLIDKARVHDRLRGRLNARQEKALERMFREGPEGFKGGLSAENYLSITGASRATATRDLSDLVGKGGLVRTGERRHTRYWLNMAGVRPQPSAKSGFQSNRSNR